MKFEVLITCDKENEDKIENCCEQLYSLVDFTENSGDEPTLSSYARYGFMCLTKEEVEIVFKDLLDNNVLCDINIIKADEKNWRKQ